MRISNPPAFFEILLVREKKGGEGRKKGETLPLRVVRHRGEGKGKGNEVSNARASATTSREKGRGEKKKENDEFIETNFFCGGGVENW